MSREDWAVFEEMRRERQQIKAERRAAFNPGPPWTRHHETHWSRPLLGDRLDYWPGPRKWRWRGRTRTGDVMAFIAKQEKTDG